MTASPAADWLPTNGVRPDLPAHTVVEYRMRHRPDHACNPSQVSDLRWDWRREPSDILEYRLLAPAQPAEVSLDAYVAEQERDPARKAALDKAREAYAWHPTTILPAEGCVVDVRRLDFVGSSIKIGKVVDGKWLVSVIGGGFITPTNHYEWRYPPGERVEATINAAGQAATSDKATVASTTALKGRSAEQLPVPAAPQRQNLAICEHVWATDKTGRVWCYLCGQVQRGAAAVMGDDTASVECPSKGALLQSAPHPLPPLHRVTVERERIRFLLAYKGRIPMTEEPRPILNALPAGALKRWK